MRIKAEGFIIDGPDKPRKDSYIRYLVRVDTDKYGTDSNAAWSDAVSLMSGIIGTLPTEDNTVGQVVQTMGASNQYANSPVVGRAFQLSFNLYGMGVRKVHKRIEDAVWKYGRYHD